MTSLPAVRDVLPHRYPMLLVDRVITMVPGERLVAEKCVTWNEPWYAGLAEGADDAYPASLIIESWGQSAAFLAADRADPSAVMLFGSVADATLHRSARPGDVIEHRVMLSRAIGADVVFEGESWIGDEKLLTVGRMVLAFRPPAPAETENPPGGDR